MSNKYPHQITIEWGSTSWRKMGEDDPETYRFETKAELDAFMLGVVEAEGWNGFDVIHDSREDDND